MELKKIIKEKRESIESEGQMLTTRKGQITIFIVLGIILLVGGIMMLSFGVVPMQDEAPEKNLEANPLVSYMRGCLTDALKESVGTVAIQGGYMIPPNLSYPIKRPYKVPYYYAGGTHVPSKSVIEEDIGELVSMLMPACDTGYIERQGYELETGEMQPHVTLGPRKVMVDLEYPVTLKKDDVAIKRDEFSATIDSRLGEYLNYSAQITEHIQQSGRIPLSEIVSLGEEEEFHTDIIHLDGATVFRIFDNESIPVQFNFAARFNTTEEEIPDTTIHDIPPQHASVGYEFTYTLLTPNLTAHTPMFNITDRKIRFTPSPGDEGEHMIMISSGHDWTYMNLTISANNEPPRIDPISDKYLDVGENFSYQVSAHDNGTIFYHARTELEGFNLSVQDGNISFTPEDTHVGTHNVTIVAVDIYGGTDNETFEVTVNG